MSGTVSGHGRASEGVCARRYGAGCDCEQVTLTEGVWCKLERGGYGYTSEIPVKVVRYGPTRVLVIAPLAAGGTRLVWIDPRNLHRPQPPRPVPVHLSDPTHEVLCGLRRGGERTADPARVTCTGCLAILRRRER